MSTDLKNAGDKTAKEPHPQELPAGDSPPPPAWLLPLAAAAWALWLVFLLWMLWFRPASPS